MYLYETNGARLLEGYYVYYWSEDSFKSITGPLPEIEHRPTSDAPFFVFSSGGLGKGVESRVFQLVHIHLDRAEVTRRNLFSFQNDAEQGDCSRAEYLGLTVSTYLKGMTVASRPNGWRIDFAVIEEDCKTLQKEAKKYRYEIARDGTVTESAIAPAR